MYQYGNRWGLPGGLFPKISPKGWGFVVRMCSSTWHCDVRLLAFSKASAALLVMDEGEERDSEERCVLVCFGANNRRVTFSCTDATAYTTFERRFRSVFHDVLPSSSVKLLFQVIRLCFLLCYYCIEEWDIRGVMY